MRGGFPTQTQVRVTSEPMSVVVGFGSTTIRGATEGERSGLSESQGPEGQRQSVSFSSVLAHYLPGFTPISPVPGAPHPHTL